MINNSETLILGKTGKQTLECIFLVSRLRASRDAGDTEMFCAKQGICLSHLTPSLQQLQVTQCHRNRRGLTESQQITRRKTKYRILHRLGRSTCSYRAISHHYQHKDKVSSLTSRSFSLRSTWKQLLHNSIVPLSGTEWRANIFRGNSGFLSQHKSVQFPFLKVAELKSISATERVAEQRRWKQTTEQQQRFFVLLQRIYRLVNNLHRGGYVSVGPWRTSAFYWIMNSSDILHQQQPSWSLT